MITTVSFDVFMRDLEPELVRCPVPVIERRLREAAIEACEDANVWREELTIATEIDVLEYDLLDGSNDDIQIHSVLCATLNGRPLAYHGDFHVDDRGSITLSRKPMKVGSLLVHITLKPSREALVMGDILYRDYHKMIVQGTLAKAYDMKQRMWSNPDEAKKHRVVFEEEIADAKRAIDRGFVTGTQRIRSRPFALATQGSMMGRY